MVEETKTLPNVLDKSPSYVEPEEFIDHKAKELLSAYKGEGKQERCNCNDEFRTVPCPIHFKNKKKDVIQKDPVIIGDDKLIDIRSWVGHVFSCPACGTPSIMHFGNYCMNCGLHILIQSHKVNESIEKMMKGEDV